MTKKGGVQHVKPDDRQDNTQVEIRPKSHTDRRIEQKVFCTKRKEARLVQKTLGIGPN
jgi:hypothetical protein